MSFRSAAPGPNCRPRRSPRQSSTPCSRRSNGAARSQGATARREHWIPPCLRDASPTGERRAAARRRAELRPSSRAATPARSSRIAAPP